MHIQMTTEVTFILDVAAGVLIAAGIVGLISLGGTFARWAQVDGDSGVVGSVIGLIGVAVGIGLVVARLLRWP